MRILIAILCLTLIGWAGPAFAAGEAVEAVGSVKTVQGDCTILRDGGSMAAAVGSKIYQNDTLVTGPGASAGIIFKDNTIMSIGPDSRLTIDKFAFDPANQKFAFTTKIIRGTLTCYTGLIAKLSNRSFRVETQTAVIGVRGTRFAVKVEDD